MSDLIVGPEWIDHSFEPNMGLFPLAVERYLNSAVARHAPGVTTVTVSARYYALHALVASHAESSSLSDVEARSLLRRCEVVFALVSIAHEESESHDLRAAPPHGADFLRPLLATGEVDLDVVADVRPSGTYAKATWGFWGAYRGSEMSLQIMAQSGFVPGKAYDDDVVRSSLGALIRVAQSKRPITLDDVVQLGEKLCLCRTSSGDDAEWLAQRFVGDAASEDMAGVLGKTMSLVKTTIVESTINSPEDAARFIMYDPRVTDGDGFAGCDVWRRWRGIALRGQMVGAWRHLWADVCGQMTRGGAAVPIVELRNWAAQQAPPGSVRAFAASLPPTTGGDGNLYPAEIEAGSTPNDVVRSLSILFLAAHRVGDLGVAERLGFQGEPGKSAFLEELSPNWMRTVIDDWNDRPMTEFVDFLVGVMLARSQRLALLKSRFNPKTGKFVYPARVHVRDELAFSVYPETARPPSLRIAQLMSMSRQVGLLRIEDSGTWALGPRKDLYA